MLNHRTAMGIYREKERRMLEERDREWLRRLSRTTQPPPAPAAVEIAVRRIPSIPGATRAAEWAARTPSLRTWRVSPGLHTPRVQS